MAFAHSETPEHVRATLGAILRRRRESAERSLGAVAYPAGVSVGFLSEVERGRKDVSTERLLAICGALETTVAEVYQELARELGAPEGPLWAVSPDADPRLQLRRATRVLDPDALRSVAQFSAYLAMAQQQPEKPRRQIGFL